MKVVQSSFFRALCAVIVGGLLIAYREQTVTWITIAIGVLFFLSGVISIVSYYSARRQAEKTQVLLDAEGRQISGIRPTPPIVGIGSLILGGMLAAMPNVFINGLMFILSIILIMGAVTQLVNLSTARKMGSVGIVFWLFPCVILLIGILALVKPSVIASAPLLVIGWTMVVYGIAELANALKLSNNRRKWTKMTEVKDDGTETAASTAEQEQAQ